MKPVSKDRDRPLPFHKQSPLLIPSDRTTRSALAKPVRSTIALQDWRSLLDC
jgi:hypothetical protein